MADDIVIRLRDVVCWCNEFDGVCDACQAANEIERLRRWKWEATTVIERWEAVFDMVKPRPADLGRSKAAIVADEIKRLRAAGDQLAYHVRAENAKEMYTAVRKWQEARRG